MWIGIYKAGVTRTSPQIAKKAKYRVVGKRIQFCSPIKSLVLHLMTVHHERVAV